MGITSGGIDKAQELVEKLSVLTVKVSRRVGYLQTVNRRSVNSERISELSASVAHDANEISLLASSLRDQFNAQEVRVSAAAHPSSTFSPVAASYFATQEKGRHWNNLPGPHSDSDSAGSSPEVERLRAELAEYKAREGAILYQNRVLQARYAEAVAAGAMADDDSAIDGHAAAGRFMEVRQIAAERARLEAENSRLRRRLQQVSSADGVSTALSPDASLSFSYAGTVHEGVPVESSDSAGQPTLSAAPHDDLDGYSSRGRMEDEQRQQQDKHDPLRSRIELMRQRAHEATAAAQSVAQSSSLVGSGPVGNFSPARARAADANVSRSREHGASAASRSPGRSATAAHADSGSVGVSPRHSRSPQRGPGVSLDDRKVPADFVRQSRDARSAFRAVTPPPRLSQSERDRGRSSDSRLSPRKLTGSLQSGSRREQARVSSPLKRSQLDGSRMRDSVGSDGDLVQYEEEDEDSALREFEQLEELLEATPTSASRGHEVEYLGHNSQLNDGDAHSVEEDDYVGDSGFASPMRRDSHNDTSIAVHSPRHGPRAQATPDRIEFLAGALTESQRLLVQAREDAAALREELHRTQERRSQAEQLLSQRQDGGQASAAAAAARELQELHSQAQLQLRALQTRLAQQTEVVSEVETARQAADEARLRAEATVAQLQSASSERQDLALRLNALQAEHAACAEVKDSYRRFDAELTLRDARLEDIATRLADTTARLAVAEHELTVTREARDTLRARLTDCECRLVAAQADSVTTAQLQSVLAEKASLTAQLERATAEKSALSAQVQQYAKEQSSMTEKVGSLTRAVAGAEEQHSNTAHQLQVLLTENGQCREQISQMKDEIDLRNRMIADAAAQIAVYERELAATHTDRNVAHAELSALQEQIRSQQDRSVPLTESSELHRLTNELARTVEYASILRQNAEVAESAYAELAGKYRSLQLRYAALVDEEISSVKEQRLAVDRLRSPSIASGTASASVGASVGSPRHGPLAAAESLLLSPRS